MIEAHTYEAICRELTNKARWSEVKLAGILFARPNSPLAKEEVVPNLSYFHRRSANKVHFFCCGYGAYWQPDDYNGKIKVAQIDHADWYFSEDMFDKLRRDFEGKTNWEYSGATDLLLLSLEDDASKESVFNFRTALKFPLDKMKADGSICNAETFFEDVFRFADRYAGTDATTDFVNPPNTGQIKYAPANIGRLWERATDCWKRQDFAGVLHACASIIETMAKHIIQTPSIQNQPLGGFFEKYRKHSNLPPSYLDEVQRIYNLRNTTPIAGHGSINAPGLSTREAQRIFDFTSSCVRLEYEAYAARIGTLIT